jgi:hypothetical protein
MVADHVFADHRVVLHVSFSTGRARLGILARDGVLLRASRAAYDEGIVGLARAPGTAVVLPRLAAVRLAGLADTDHCARLALRWQALAADGRVFPALEADLMLTPAGEQITLLAVAATYWLPPGRAGAGPDQAMAQRCAVATVRNLMALMACALVHPAGATGSTRAGPPHRSSAEEMP